MKTRLAALTLAAALVTVGAAGSATAGASAAAAGPATSIAAEAPPDSPLGEVFARNSERIIAATETLETQAREQRQGEVQEQSAASAAEPPLMFQRLGGASRYETAVQISQAAFMQPELWFGGVVFVANGMNFPDALAAGPVAATWGAPILLVPPTGGLPGSVRDEIIRLEPSDIVILGKTDNVSAEAERQLASLITDPEGGVSRIAGANRFQTSALLSLEVYDWRHSFREPTTALITAGRTYADALAGGMAGAWEGAPLLLADGSRLDPWVAEALAPAEAEPGYPREFTTVRILGSTATVSQAIEDEVRAILPDAQIIRYAGRDRFDTAASLNVDAYAGALAGTGHPAVLTNGYRFPDALAGASLARRGDTRMVLTRTECLPAPSGDTITTFEPHGLTALGWTDAVSDDVLFHQRRCP